MYRLKGIISCLLDLFIQVFISAAEMFTKDEPLDEHEEKISS